MDAADRWIRDHKKKKPGSRKRRKQAAKKTDHTPPKDESRKKRKPKNDGYSLRNFALRKMGFMRYEDYLQSKLWKSIRKRVLSRDLHRCVCCNEVGRQCHHMSYKEHVLRGIVISSIVSVCGNCHKIIEFGANGKKRSFALAQKKAQKLISQNPRNMRIARSKMREAKHEFALNQKIEVNCGIMSGRLGRITTVYSKKLFGVIVDGFGETELTSDSLDRV